VAMRSVKTITVFMVVQNTLKKGEKQSCTVAMNVNLNL